MKNTFEQQIYEIFGTTDPKELRKLSKDAKQYQQLAKKEALRHAAGRKPAFSLPQIIQMAAMQQQGKSIAEIARTFQVSRQTVYNQIARAHCFSTDPDVKRGCVFFTAISFAQRLISTSVMRKLQSRITQKKFRFVPLALWSIRPGMILPGFWKAAVFPKHAIMPKIF